MWLNCYPLINRSYFQHIFTFYFLVIQRDIRTRYTRVVLIIKMSAVTFYVDNEEGQRQQQRIKNKNGRYRLYP